MKVAHITPSFYPAHYYGGPTQSVYQLCRCLPAEGFDVRVLTTNANGPGVLNVDTAGETDLLQGLSVAYRKRQAREAISAAFLRDLASYVRWADLVHLTAVYSFPTIPALWTARRYRKPVVWSPRGSLQRWSGTSNVQLKRAWERLCLWVAPPRLALHVTSPEEALSSEQRMPGIKAHVVPNGADVPAAKPRGKRGGALRLLYLGRLHPIKAVDRLLDACGEIQYQDWTLDIAGTGEAEYVHTLRQQADRIGIAGRVRFRGQLVGEEKERLFEEADALILPSHSENFGMAALEALAHGVPVIASTGTPWKTMTEVGCGLWVENDPASLAGAIGRIGGMDLSEMGRRGRDWVARDYGWQSVARRMGQLYHRVAEV